jgi:protein-S-isoprenylcysteine O-methyltransferase Ste14
VKKAFRHNFLDYVAYLLMIACFPLNPLVFLNIIKPYDIKPLFYIGAFFWLVGMVMVIYPFFYFRSKGDVARGKAYVHTNKIVCSGLYSVVRHVQYTGGILSIFFATPFLYPHWIFVVMGIPGIWLTWLGTKREDQYLIKKFGDDYREYMELVPSMNLLTGIYRKIKSRQE